MGMLLCGQSLWKTSQGNPENPPPTIRELVQQRPFPQLAEMAGCVGNMLMRHLGSGADYQGSNLSFLGTLGT